MEDYGFLRVAAAVPVVKVADTRANAENICRMTDEASRKEVSLVVFPELCVTGYTCGDLFAQELLVREAEKAVRRIMDHTRGKDITVVVGTPVRFEDRLYNCAVIMSRKFTCLPTMNITNPDGSPRAVIFSAAVHPLQGVSSRTGRILSGRGSTLR